MICTEYAIDGVKEHVRKFLDAEEYELLNDFEKNQERIKECIKNHGRQVLEVDDMPYLIGLGMDIILDLHKEFRCLVLEISDNHLKLFFTEFIILSLKALAVQIADQFKIRVIRHGIHAAARFQII